MISEFFKAYIPQNCSTQMKVCSSFKTRLEQVSSGEATIERNATNKKWRVMLVKENGEFFFRNGWEEFVVENDLKLGEFLVFQYYGDLNFKVDIYGTNCWERVDAIDVVVIDDDDDVVMDEDDDGAQGSDLVDADDDDDDEDEEYDAGYDDGDGDDDDDNEEDEDKEEEDEDMVFKKKSFFYRGRNAKNLPYVHRAFKKQTKPNHGGKAAIRDAESYRSKSKLPNFMVCISESYTRVGIMHIPSVFVFKYLPNVSKVFLSLNGHTWQAKVCSYSCKKQRGQIYYKLGRGFGKFVDENNIVPGDVCVFELAAQYDNTFIVTLKRQSDYDGANGSSSKRRRNEG